MTDVPASYHVPVLLPEVLEAGGPARRVVDGTLGGGGHAAAFLARGAEVLGIDRDPEALAAARGRLGDRGISFFVGAFGSRAALDAIRRFRPDLILLDLGVSSHQLDAEARGFTFRPGAPLDMRMGTEGATAADWLNDTPEEELRRVFREYGDERRSAALAREILRRRSRQAFAISDDLVNAIRAVLGPRSGPADFARLFQAVRIAVNDELEGLAEALPELRDALAPGGGLAVISYHSGEDRIVKHLFREWARDCVCPPETPRCVCRGHALGIASRRSVVAGEAEVAANPRARSARLRVFRVSE
ncbi:MAG: 16S rRNA (cytosine(1402)-N(4))-methyltransferase RsmH [Gemmatimonadales bacterium]